MRPDPSLIFIFVICQGLTPGFGEEPERVGASTCVSCHSQREAFSKASHAKGFENAKKIAFEESCETCHGPGSLHVGSGGDKENKDYFTTSFKKKTNSQINTLCFSCHNLGSQKHWQNSSHERSRINCLTCHSVHSSKGEHLLVKESQKEVCSRCHSGIAGKMKRLYRMPFSEKKHTCTGCHNPHGTFASKMLVKNAVNETCFQCHADKRGPFLWEHSPVRESCLNCHDPHGSSNHAMLSSRLPFLCQKCHQKGSFHPTGKLLSKTDLTNESVFLINRSCVNCHSLIHGSSHPSGKGLTR